MVTALASFPQTIVDAEKCIDNAAADEPSIQRQLSHGCGLLEGYYRAGGVSKLEYEQGCVYLRRVAAQRISIVQFQHDAQESGVADDV